MPNVKLGPKGKTNDKLDPKYQVTLLDTSLKFYCNLDFSAHNF